MLIKINSNLKVVPNKKGINLYVRINKHDKYFTKFTLSKLDLEKLKVIIQILQL